MNDLLQAASVHKHEATLKDLQMKLDFKGGAKKAFFSKHFMNEFYDGMFGCERDARAHLKTHRSRRL